MSQKPTVSFLVESIRLLVKHFGVDRVRAALPKELESVHKPTASHMPPSSGGSGPKTSPNIKSMLEQLRGTDEEKYYLLQTFYLKLKDAVVLPESQDIRQFAQDIGLKEITGKSRRDLVPKLMRFLTQQPTERLRADLSRASSVSEQQRRQGYSILTDKLLGDN